MKCPACKTVALSASALEEDLSSQQCSRCGGHWIEGKRYMDWLEAHKSDLPPSPNPPESLPAVQDTGPAKFCPVCQRFLSHCRVGRGVDFFLDRCGTCGGIWLDANEWNVLKSRNLHNELHKVFSAAWQAEVLRQQTQKNLEQMLIEKLGPADFAEIRRIKNWIDQHPKRSELYAFLANRD